MEKKLKTVTNKLCVMSWLNKDGFEVRALGIDLGYTFKMLSFKAQDIAEVLGLAVVDFVLATPIVPGQKTKYPVEV